MPDYSVFVTTVVLLAAVRISLMAHLAWQIGRTLSDRSAAAQSFRTECALKCVHHALGYADDVHWMLRRLVA